MFCLIILSAIGPCPCPKLMLSKLLFLSLLKFEIETKGSDPADKIYKSGILQFESGKMLFKSNGRDLAKSSPKLFLTKIVKPYIILSDLRHLNINNFSLNEKTSYY